MRSNLTRAVILAVVAAAGFGLHVRAQEEDLDEDELALQQVDVVPRSPIGFAGHQIVSRTTPLKAIADNEFATAGLDVACPAGKKVIGGGCRPDNPEWGVSDSSALNATTWRCRVTALGGYLKGSGIPGTSANTLQAQAICAIVE